MSPATRTLLHVRTWLTPLIIILSLAVAFPAIYLASTVNPQGTLEDLPVALVITPQSASTGPDLATGVADAIVAGAGTTLAITPMSGDAMAELMDTNALAGAIVIPADFNASIGALLAGSAPDALPEVAIASNAGAGGLSVGLLGGNVTPLLTGVATGLGDRLNAQTAGAPLPPATRILLAQPFHITSSPYRALPANAGLGTSVFYYALVLVLIGFVGASLINPIIDSALGFAPSELGPIVQRNPYTAATRLQTLLAKFAVIVAVAPLAALATQAISTGPVGIPVSAPVTLWLFSTAVIAAIGTSALTVFAVFGSGIGALVNTIFFIALSMTSSGGTVPLAATPQPFRALSTIEPFQPIVDGLRALLYYDGNAAAGLSDAWVRVGAGGVIGIVLGLVVAVLYGRVARFSRHPEGVERGVARLAS